LINPVRVQGTGAAAEIATAISELSSPSDIWPPLEIVILARGGGSIEDLWEFNEEIVARAIASSLVPIVSAVGHEIDFTIADFVADLRAPTPSAAAELIVPDMAELERRIGQLENCLHRCLRTFVAREQTRLRLFSRRALSNELFRRVRDGQQTLDWTRENLLRNAQQFLGNARSGIAEQWMSLRRHDPTREIVVRRDRFAELTRRLMLSGPASARAIRQRFEQAEKILAVLGPQATLRRGYSITRGANGRVIRSSQGVKAGDALRTKLADGSVDSTVVATG
jgi:exodeoxyribonuclease VII large subunit